MSPESNTEPNREEPSRAPATSRVRRVSPEIDALVEKLGAIDPRRSEIVARARSRLATGALDTAAVARETARRFLSRDED